MEVILILLALGILVGVPALALIAYLRAGLVGRRVQELETEVAKLKIALARHSEFAPGMPGFAPAAPAPAAEVGDTAAAGGIDPAAISPARPSRPDEPSPAAVEPDAPAIAAAAFATTPPPLPPSSPPVDVPTPARPASLEEQIGTRWVVWIGGVALALGGVFLVKFSIELGIFGPLGRIMLGGLFAAVLIGAGEWFRRNGIGETGTAVPSAHIPGILTAAGTISAFATIFAAHALYDLIGPGVAFVALALVAIATLVAALLHGPWLAALGLIGAHVVPFLVATDRPSLLGFVGYEMIVGAAALTLAHLRAWRWISDSALALAIAVAFLVQFEYGRPSLHGNNLGLGLHILGLVALIALFRAHLEHESSPYLDRPADWRVVAMLTAVAVLALFRLAVLPSDPMNGLVVAIVVGAGFALAGRWSALAPTAGATALVAGLGVLGWRPDLAWEAQLDTFAMSPPPNLNLRPAAINEFLVTAASSGLAVLAAGLLPSLRTAATAPRATAWLIGGGGLGAILILLAAWGRVDLFATSGLFAGAALALAFLLASAAEWLFPVEAAALPLDPADADAGTIGYASGTAAVLTVATLGLACGIGLEAEALTLAIAAMLPALAWIHGLRPWPGLRKVALIVALALGARIGWVVLSEGFSVGPRPIVNALLLVFALPAVACWWAARRFARAGRDIAVEGLEALALVFAGLLFVFEIRHLVNDGDIWHRGSSLAEVGLQVSGGFLMALLTSLASSSGNSPVLRAGAAALRALTLIAAGPGLMLLLNPLITHDGVRGAWPLDTLLLGYGVPAIMAALAAWWISRYRDRAGGDGPAASDDLVTRLVSPDLLGGCALMLALTWVLFSVRLWSVGPLLHAHGVSDGELWAYSVVLIAFGIVALGFGLATHSPSARRAAFGLIALAALKVFLIDLGNLSGLPRALSFIGLGATLIGIGLLYQKLTTMANAARRDDSPPTSPLK